MTIPTRRSKRLIGHGKNVQILRARPGGVALDRSVLVEEVQVRCAYLGKGQSGAAGELLAGRAMAPDAGRGERG